MICKQCGKEFDPASSTKWYVLNHRLCLTCGRLRQKQYYQKYRPKSLMIKKKYYREHREEIRERAKHHHQLHRQEDSARNKKHYYRVYREKLRERWKNIKIDVLSHYSGGSIKCSKCGIGDIRVLTIDHISGGGTRHIKTLGGGKGFYSWLKKNNYPDSEKYQVLCMNCQWIKRNENDECLKNNTHA